MTKAIAPSAIDRRALMLAAWANTRRIMVALGYAAHQMRTVFAAELRKAWAAAKAAAKAATTPVKDHSVKLAIVALNNKDRWTQADYARMDALRLELREAA
ncbi:hypothetical protein [Jannaschia sp. CCS1]|uniref:hypothetical protein n=1 Tax=Jannaschia sp. (strain CCS1) TaxID=290400 RepID=UPI000053C7E8|nr:hypothetical protein [Jannaschia sp. CCS1]ABD53158.1 hypothetical protein Jann_0241 [Jannaschia sp. CCS1]